MPSYDNKVLTGDQLVYFSGLVKTALASKADSSALAGKQDALVFDGTYNASSNPVATMSSFTTFKNSITVNDGLTYSPGDNEIGLNIAVDDPNDLGFLSFGGDGEGQMTLTIDWDQPIGDNLTVEFDSVSGDPIKLTDVLGDKQDALVFNTAYNSVSNKVATMADITTALGGISSFSFEIVQALPQSDISTSKIYLVAKQTAGTNQVYTEYAYVNNGWEIIGDTSMTIDTLTNQEVATIWNAASAT